MWSEVLDSGPKGYGLVCGVVVRVLDSGSEGYPIGSKGLEEYVGENGFRCAHWIKAPAK